MYCTHLHTVTFWQNYVKLWKCAFHNETKAFPKSHLKIKTCTRFMPSAMRLLKDFSPSVAYLFKTVKTIRYNLIAILDQYYLLSVYANCIDVYFFAKTYWNHIQESYCLHQSIILTKKYWCDISIVFSIPNCLYCLTIYYRVDILFYVHSPYFWWVAIILSHFMFLLYAIFIIILFFFAFCRRPSLPRRPDGKVPPGVIMPQYT